MSNELYRPLKDGSEFTPLIAKPKCKRISEGKGNTYFSVQKMSEVVSEYSWHTTQLAKLLQNRSLNLAELCQNIQDFLYWHIQYLQDGKDQLLRSPGCSWKERKTGVDCKSYSVFAASILRELGIKSFFRRVSYSKGEPYKHVYVVVPINQESPDLENKYSYFFIDGTINVNTNALFEPHYYKKDDYMSNLDHYTLAKPRLGNPEQRDWSEIIASKVPNNSGALGQTKVGGIIQDAKSSATNAATTAAQSAVSNAVSSATSSVTDFIKGIFSGPTGAAGVDMENERKIGDTYFHMAKIGGKWRDFDYVLKQMGKGGLQAFGWGDGKVPSSSAQKKFKQAEDAFFSVLAPFLDKVIAGTVMYPESFLNDPIMISYLEKMTSPKYSTPATTSVSVPTKNVSINTNSLGPSKASTLQLQSQPQTKKAGGGVVGIILTAAALGMAVYGFSISDKKPKKVAV